MPTFRVPAQLRFQEHQDPAHWNGASHFQGIWNLICSLRPEVACAWPHARSSNGEHDRRDISGGGLGR